MSPASAARHTARLATVSFVRHGDGVLLLRHPPSSDRFAGRWNGIGGHVEAGEDVRASARRELREEAGIHVKGLRLRGVIHEAGMQGHAYVIFLFVGEAPSRALHPAPGLELRWQPLADLDALDVVDDVRELLPRLLGAEDPVFVTETFDGSDRRLTIRIDPGADET